MAETVVSYLIFIIAYLNMRAEPTHARPMVRAGPMVKLVTFYQWIR